MTPLLTVLNRLLPLAYLALLIHYGVTFFLHVATEHELPDHDVLFSTAEYKKTSMKYFQEADEPGRVSK